MQVLVFFIVLVLATGSLAAETEMALFAAASQGRLSRVQSILAQGVAVDARTPSGRTPLMGAAFFGNESVVRLLIGYGADVNATDNRGVTPLMDAVSGGWPEVVKVLLAAGADVTAKDAAGHTVLERARQQGRPDLVALLEAAGAQPARQAPQPSQAQAGQKDKEGAAGKAEPAADKAGAQAKEEKSS